MTFLVVAAALQRADGRILLQQRPAGTAHAGLWEFPGGKVEPGEDVRGALARELAEELGIAVIPGTLAPCRFVTAPHGKQELLLLLFLCQNWSEEIVMHHGAALAWVHADEFADYPMPPADIALAAELRAISNRS